MAQKAFSPTRYKDIDLNFSAHPVTGDVVTVNDDTAIKRAIQNLVLLNYYEKPFHPEIGSPVFGMFFENADPSQNLRLAREIELLIENWEPRVSVDEVIAEPKVDSNEYIISVRFFILNVPNPGELQEFSFLLEAIR